MSDRMTMKLYYLKAPENSYKYSTTEIAKCACRHDIVYYIARIEVENLYSSPSYEERVMFTRRKDVFIVSGSLPFDDPDMEWRTIETTASFKVRFS